ncbi:DEAD/DEAH box helicase [uncultured Helicobacter sp.]|uniref:DEAD/DEAH box helicase n=1 Tax=uncultured Helicobacter sp. TaxID=175537 RepID=UPI00374E803A
MIQGDIYTFLSRECAQTKDFKNAFVLICRDYEEARASYEVLDFCRTHRDFSPFVPFVLPEVRAHFGDDLTSFREDLLELLQVLRAFYQCQNPKILCAPISSILYPLPKAEFLQSFVIDKDTPLDSQFLAQKLLSYGYENVEVVEIPGEMSVRGEIVDIFLPNASNPHRICFFNECVESIRIFDVSTQLSQKTELHSLEIPVALFGMEEEDITRLGNANKELPWDSETSLEIGASWLWHLGEKGGHLSASYPCFITPSALEEAKEIYSIEENLHSAISLDCVCAMPLIPSSEECEEILFNPKMLPSLLALHKQKEIMLITPNYALLKSYGLDYSITPPRLLQPLDANLSHIRVVIGTQNVNILHKQWLILSFNQAQKRTKKPKRSRLQLNELNVGEYVVHTDYGIGVFKGLSSTSVLGVVRDFIEIAYQGEDKLLLPVERLDLIDRYVADSGTLPIVDKLGKGSFSKLKDSVRKKLFEIAGGIIELAAQRALLEGVKITRDCALLYAFDKTRPFALTEDQERSIEEILSDLESGRVMDRLLSGDVGFGKTEVAMSAIVALVAQGYQCAFIVPTTLLATQHFATLQERLGVLDKSDKTPIQIAKIDRFTKDKSKLSAGVKNGEIDVVVGTHALLGLEFSKLGLVVIDEEHKFGVKQKEKMKALCKNVHTLSMSATPIPRTLNMALSHIKGFSALRTPPMERKGVRTFLKVYDDRVIREAILRELRRGGQVFYVYNNIAGIAQKAKELNELLPKIRIGILHSQVQDAQSQEVMLDFVRKELDMLLCTSIVESGLHLPNANTIIVEEANRFGIADLHQLRGRVGRGSKEGFCYLCVARESVLGDEAKKRLSALEKNSYLGSGENLAYHDLEIRGGGNLLGEAQSGHIKKIGYGLYLSMLEECINQLSGSGVQKSLQVDLKLNLSAYINPELVGSDKLRLELYRRLSLCENLSDVYEIEGEIENRFGKLDTFTLSFLELIKIRVLANALNLKQIAHYGQNITITYSDNTKERIESPSKDWDDVLGSVMVFLRKKHECKQNISD